MNYWYLVWSTIYTIRNHVFVAGLKLAYSHIELKSTEGSYRWCWWQRGGHGSYQPPQRVEAEEEFYIIFQETFEESEQIGRYLVVVAGKPFCTYRWSYNDVKLQPSFSNFIYSLISQSDTQLVYFSNDWYFLVVYPLFLKKPSGKRLLSLLRIKTRLFLQKENWALLLFVWPFVQPFVILQIVWQMNGNIKINWARDLARRNVWLAATYEGV